VKVTIAFENCNCEVTGEYHPAEYEDGFLFMGPEFYVEDFSLVFPAITKQGENSVVYLDDLPVGMVDSKFFDELEQRCIDKIEEQRNEQ
jgi:hypothetical protein